MKKISGEYGGCVKFSYPKKVSFWSAILATCEQAFSRSICLSECAFYPVADSYALVRFEKNVMDSINGEPTDSHHNHLFLKFRLRKVIGSIDMIRSSSLDRVLLHD